MLEVESLEKNVKDCAATILQNWEFINFGMENCTTKIILAASFFKLCRIETKLLTEPWQESLRKEAIATRDAYLSQIDKSHYID